MYPSPNNREQEEEEEDPEIFLNTVLVDPETHEPLAYSVDNFQSRIEVPAIVLGKRKQPETSAEGNSDSRGLSICQRELPAIVSGKRKKLETNAKGNSANRTEDIRSNQLEMQQQGPKPPSNAASLVYSVEPVKKSSPPLGNPDKWTHETIMVLLDAHWERHQKRIVSENKSVLSGTDWDYIVEVVRGHDREKSRTQIQGKLDSLKLLYRRHKNRQDSNLATSWPYFSKIKRICD